MLSESVSCNYTFRNNSCLSHMTKFSQNFSGKNGLFIRRRPEKKCFKCSGFGIIRCSLCKGKGLVFYEKKYLRFDPCPKCFQKRFDTCPVCKGVGERMVYGEPSIKKFFSGIIRIFDVFG
nr:hypothetical protein 1634Bnrm1_p056 [Cryptomonas sp.]